MQVIIVHNPLSKTKGLLRSVSVEVDPNVFVSNLSKERLLEVYNQILQSESDSGAFRITLVEPATVEPGFSLKGFGNNPHETTVLDGIILKTKVRRNALRVKT